MDNQAYNKSVSSVADSRIAQITIAKLKLDSKFVKAVYSRSDYTSVSIKGSSTMYAPSSSLKELVPTMLQKSAYNKRKMERGF